MNILKELEIRLKKSFNGKTGYDLKDYIIENHKVIYEGDDFIDLSYYSNRFDYKACYSVYCNREGLAALADYLLVDDILGLDDDVFYLSIEEALASKNKSFEVDVDIIQQGEFKSLASALRLLARLSKERKLEFNIDKIESCCTMNELDIDIKNGSFNKQNFVIWDNGPLYFLNSYLELAEYAADESLDSFIDTLINGIMVIKGE